MDYTSFHLTISTQSPLFVSIKTSNLIMVGSGSNAADRYQLLHKLADKPMTSDKTRHKMRAEMKMYRSETDVIYKFSADNK